MYVKLLKLRFLTEKFVINPIFKCLFIFFYFFFLMIKNPKCFIFIHNLMALLFLDATLNQTCSNMRSCDKHIVLTPLCEYSV